MDIYELYDDEDREHVKLYNGAPMSAIPAAEDLQSWIERNPTGMKSYKRRSQAHRVASTLAQEVAAIHETASPALYTLVEFEDRYYPVIFVNELIARPEAIGGYIAHVAAQGFMQA